MSLLPFGSWDKKKRRRSPPQCVQYPWLVTPSPFEEERRREQIFLRADCLYRYSFYLKYKVFFAKSKKLAQLFFVLYTAVIAG